MCPGVPVSGLGMETPPSRYAPLCEDDMSDSTSERDKAREEFINRHRNGYLENRRKVEYPKPPPRSCRLSGCPNKVPNNRIPQECDQHYYSGKIGAYIYNTFYRGNDRKFPEAEIGRESGHQERVNQANFTIFTIGDL